MTSKKTLTCDNCGKDKKSVAQIQILSSFGHVYSAKWCAGCRLQTCLAYQPEQEHPCDRCAPGLRDRLGRCANHQEVQ